MRRILLVGLLAALVSAGYMWGQSRRVRIAAGGEPYVRTYRDATRGLKGAMAAGDGQAYGALAQDPTMARPEVFAGGGGDAAYRFQRPLLGYLAWAGSLGRPEWEPGAQAAIVVLGVAGAIGACAELLRRRRVDPVLALFVLATPGVLSSLSGMTAEPIALAFLSFGLLLWWGNPRRSAAAVLCFILATLTREDSLVAIAGLAIVEALRWRDVPRSAVERALAALSVPFLAYAGWVVLVRARVHAWPLHAPPDAFSFVPFRALVHDLSRLTDPVGSWSWLLGGALLVVAACARRHDPLSAVVIAYGAFAATFGTLVWDRWQDFGRPLAPLYAYGTLIVITWIASFTRGEPAPQQPHKSTEIGSSA